MSDLARLEAQRSTHHNRHVHDRLYGAVVHRFRRGLLTSLITISLLLAGILVIAALLLFRPTTLNDLIDDQLSALLSRGKEGFSYDRSRTSITLPNLSGEGRASLFDFTIRSKDGSYDLLHIPRLDVEFDLLGLPRRPLKRVSIPDGAWVVGQLTAEGWADEGVFVSSEDDSAARVPIDLPELDVRGVVLRLCAPQILTPAPPAVAEREFFGRQFPEQHGACQYISNINLSLTPSLTLEGGLDLRFSTDCDNWGQIEAYGSIGRDLNDPQLNLHLRRSQQVNDDFARRFRDEALWTYDLLSARGPSNSLDLHANLGLKDGKTTITADVLYRGSIMYAKVPLVAHDVTCLLHFDGANLKIVDATGRRKGAVIRARGAVNNVGQNTESVDIELDIRGIALDADTLSALSGVLDADGKRRWPEWQEYKRSDSSILATSRAERDAKEQAGDTSLPEFVVVPEAFATIDRYLEPGGLANVLVNVDSRRRSGDNIDVTAILVDASVRAVGDLGVLAEYAATMPARYGADDAPGLRALGILGDERAVLRPDLSEEPVASFPLQLYNVRGVVRAEIPSSDRSTVSVRGLTEAEALQVSQQLAGRDVQSTKGLIAFRRISTQSIPQSIQIEGVISDDNPATADDDSEIQLDVSSSELSFDKGLEDLLPSNIRRALAAYSLREGFRIERAIVRVAPIKGGQANIDLRLTPLRMTASVRLGDARDALDIRRIRGQVVYRSASNTVELEGLSAGLSAPLEGVAASNFSMTLDLRNERLNLRGALRDVMLSEALFDVLPSQLGSIKSNFTDPATGSFLLAGKANVEVDLSIDLAGDASRFQLKIDLTDKENGQIGFSRFAPMLLGGVEGTLMVDVGPSGTTISIPSLRGKPLLGRESRKLDELAAVKISGALYQAPREAMRWHFAVLGENLELNDTLRRSLVTMLGDPRGSQIANIWRSLEPPGSAIGRIRVDATVSGADGSEPSYLVRVDMSGGKIQHESFRLPLEDVQASITIVPGDVRIDQLQGSVKNRGEISFPNISLDAQGRFAITVSARDIVLDESFGKALPESLRGAYQRVNPDGKMDADVTILVGGETIEYETRLRLKGMSLSLGLRVRDLEGVIVSHIIMPSGEGGGERLVSGEAQLTTAKWSNLELHDTQSSIQMVGGRMVLPNVRARLAGGFLRGKLELNLEQEATYSGTFVARGMRLESIASALGEATRVDIPDPDTTETDSTEDSAEPANAPVEATLRGGVDAELTFSSVANAERQIGAGRIDIGPSPIEAATLEEHQENVAAGRKGEDALIGNVPLFNGLYSVLQLGRGDHFNEAHILFRLLEDRILVRQLALISDSLRVENTGSNRIFYAPKPDVEQLQMTLVPTFFPRTPELPVLQPVLDAIKGLVFRVYVHGSLDNPRVDPLTRKRESSARAERLRRHAERSADATEDEDDDAYRSDVRPDYSRPGS